MDLFDRKKNSLKSMSKEEFDEWRYEYLPIWLGNCALLGLDVVYTKNRIQIRKGATPFYDVEWSE